jgi:transcriptional regulator with XRE-family HTH domain
MPLLTAIKERRKQLSIRQAEMALHLNISQSTYCDIENGKIRLDLEKLQLIAGVLNISITDILPPPTTTNTQQI